MNVPPSSAVENAFVPRGAREKRRLEELRRRWGKSVERTRDGQIIGMYHRSIARKEDTVDDHTWNDLDFDRVFAEIDRTSGMPGRQVLYHQLRTYISDDAALADRARQHEIFRRDPSLRENIQLLQDRLDHPNAGYIAPLLLGEMPATPTLAWLMYVLSVATPLCLAGMFFFHPLFLPGLMLVLINAAIYATYGQKIMPHFTGFSQINTLLGVAEDLGKIVTSHDLSPLGFLRISSPLITRLRQRLGLLVMDRASLPDLVQSLYGYLNMLFLFDIVIFLRSLHALRENRAKLIEVFEAVGSLDAAIAVASYLEGLPSCSVPELVAQRHIDVIGLYHPLIPAPVDNAFRLTNRSALIAGPNMAGKTAFIRTIGINLILARTLHFCLARHAVLPRAIVRSAIRREDKLSEGSSYFFAEIKQVLEFTQCGPQDPLHVFLIDEIFRGTNTTERIASSAAVLRHLARHQIVFATTHDAELQEMLGDTFAMFHFSDQVVNGTYGFDYRIHPGPVRSRNAIKLLEISGYPKAIVEEAEELAARLDSAPSPS